MSKYGDEFSEPQETPTGQVGVAIPFLHKWAPEGPWVITSIVPDGKSTTATFYPEDDKLLAMWLEERDGKENIYFHVNPTIRALSSKAAKEDIARMSWLHVDIDPRAGEDFESERERILELLQNYPKKPSVIIDSGGGYQAFWKLFPCGELEIQGKITRAQELEGYNIQLERELGADRCHNIDRIMRLPGTVNIPNAKKRKKGRYPVLAQLVEFNDWDYRIAEFVAAPQVQPTSDGALAVGMPKIKVSGNVPDLGVDDLRDWASQNNTVISDHCLALIATGQDPLDPGKYPSRSEALFRVCCDLVRAKVPDEMIFAVITGSNEIATSVRDKPHWERYALRQIERAKEEVIDPVLRQFNEKHAVIADFGGKCRIISEVVDPSMSGRTRISKQSFEDFRNRYRHIQVTVGTGQDGQPVLKSAGNFWIDHPNRRQYDTIVFAPGREIDNAYNLWKGFAVPSIPGDKHESFLVHLRDNVCSKNKDHYDYLLNWMARCVQFPDSPGEVAVVLRGAKGTGKSFMVREFGRLFGRHFLQVSDSKHLVGNFNAHLRDAVVLFGDEAFFAGDRKHESVLKTLITEETLVIEGKGLDIEIAPNYTHLLLASNDSWVVPASLDERRFFVLDVGAEHKQDHIYFHNIRQDLDDGGLENLLCFLLTRDISNYNMRKVPQTHALMEQKILSMDAETEWFYEILWEGRILRNHDDWHVRVSAETLYDEYLQRMDMQRKQYRMNPTAFGRFLAHVMPKGEPRKVREMVEFNVVNRETGFEHVVKRRAYVYYFPALSVVREHWDKTMGGPFAWPEIEEKQSSIPEKRPF